MMDIRLIMMLMAFTVMVSRAQSQTIFPYIRYKGVILPNNSYIDLSQLGDGDRIECVTDLENCCINSTGSSKVWFLPNGTKLFEAGKQEIRAFEIIEGAQQFDLRLSDPTVRSDLSLSGVYECLIDTRTAVKVRIYVGLYYNHGNVDVMMTGISGSNPPFTLTCVSTNLPPTTVEWTLNGKEFNNFTTILNNPETTQYTHTLTVSERIGGNYTCSIFAFNESSVSSAFGLDYFNVYVGAQPTNVYMHQNNSTTIHVFWSPPDSLLETVGYQIYYMGPTSGSVAVDDNTVRNVLITGLVNGGSYIISVAGKSVHLESEPVVVGPIPFGLIPGVPQPTLTSITANSVTVSWTVPSGTVVDRYELMWKIDEPRQTIHSETLPGTANRYVFPGLDVYKNATIEITVIAVNAAGENRNQPLIFHSNILQNSSEIACTATNTNIGAIIGGAVGIFFVGLVIGIVTVTAIITFKHIHNARNRDNLSIGKIPSLSHPPINQTAIDGNTNSHIQQQDSNRAVLQNSASHCSIDPATMRNVAYQEEEYDYI